jgi:hypothetical protein
LRVWAAITAIGKKACIAAISVVGLVTPHWVSWAFEKVCSLPSEPVVACDSRNWAAPLING